jgi:hypothetical protein
MTMRLVQAAVAVLTLCCASQPVSAWSCGGYYSSCGGYYPAYAAPYVTYAPPTYTYVPQYVYQPNYVIQPHYVVRQTYVIPQTHVIPQTRYIDAPPVMAPQRPVMTPPPQPRYSFRSPYVRGYHSFVGRPRHYHAPVYRYQRVRALGLAPGLR